MAGVISTEDVEQRTHLDAPNRWWFVTIAAVGLVGILALDGDARATVVVGAVSLLLAIGLVALLVRRRTWPPTSDTATELDRWVAAVPLCWLTAKAFEVAGRSPDGLDDLSDMVRWILILMLALGAVVALLLRRPPPGHRRGWATTVALTAGIACIVCCALRFTSVPFETRLAMSRSEMNTIARTLWEESDRPDRRERHSYLSTVQIDRLGDFEVTMVGLAENCPDFAGLEFFTRGSGSFVWCADGEPRSEDIHYDVRPLGGRWWLGYEPFD